LVRPEGTRREHVLDLPACRSPTLLSSQAFSGKPNISHLHHVGDAAALYCRDLLLAQRCVRDEAVVNFVAARLLMIGDERAKGDVLVRKVSLVSQYLDGCNCRIGYVGRARIQAAVSPKELRSSERRVGPGMLDYYSQACAIWYFAEISATRLNAFSAAASSSIPLCKISAQAVGQTCWFCTSA